MKHAYTISTTGIDSYLWDVQRYLYHKTSVREAETAVAPLVWYITSGRASSDFLRKLFSVKISRIGKILLASGSYDEVINSIKKEAYR